MFVKRTQTHRDRKRKSAPEKNAGSRKAWLGLLVAGALLVPVVTSIGAAATIAGRTKSRLYDEVQDVPPRPVGVVLGCSKYAPSGRLNLYFRYRVEAAARLFQAGRVDYLLVSGDNRHASYNEPRDMQRALVALGVPKERIYLDYAGLRTLDSVVRAKEVFGQNRVTLISQEFHNQRAVYIALHRRLDAVGYNARDVLGNRGLWTRSREVLARVKTLLDVHVLGTAPRFLGEPVRVGTT